MKKMEITMLIKLQWILWWSMLVFFVLCLAFWIKLEIENLDNEELKQEIMLRKNGKSYMSSL